MAGSGPQKRPGDKSSGDGGGKRERKNKVPQSHREQRELRQARRAEGNPNHELVIKLKEKWEVVRQKSTPKEQRHAVIGEILALTEGKDREIIFQHDSARVYQSLVKYGTVEQRKTVFERLREHTVELAKSKYSRHLVPKLLQFGGRAERAAIISCFYGKVTKLIRHAVAGQVLNEAYGDYAVAEERQALMEEFYGPQYALFKQAQKRSLLDIVRAHPDREEAIRKHMFQTLVPLLEKGRCTHHIVHRAILDFFSIADDKRAAEVVDLVKELAVEMLHTREGARVAMQVTWRGSAKERKAFVRSLKPYVRKIACEEYGYAVLLAVFDTVDDTVLVRKTLLAPLCEAWGDIADDPNGRKVLLYLLARRNPKYFAPHLLELLVEGDGNTHSKKNADQRARELREAVAPAAVAWANEAAADAIVGPSALLLLEALTCPLPNTLRNRAHEALVAAAISEEEPLLDHGTAHRTLRLIIAREAVIVEPTSAEEKEEEEAGADDSGSSNLLSDKLWEGMAPELERWMNINRAAFVLLSLLEHGSSKVKTALMAALRPHVKALRSQADKKGLVALADKIQDKNKKKKAN